jgi:hypothetical protein
VQRSAARRARRGTHLPSTGQPENGTYTAEAMRLTLFIEDQGKTIGNVFTKL